MDASRQEKADQLAADFAQQATTIEELNDLMRSMMKSGLERGSVRCFGLENS